MSAKSSSSPTARRSSARTNKAGVAEIMAAVETMIEKNVKHGEVRVIFTTDEEIGNGVDGLDVPGARL